MSKPQNPRAEFDRLMQQCNHASVRELAWAVGSSPLLSNTSENAMLIADFFNAAWQERVDWLHELDASSEQIAGLCAHLESGSKRLGKRFERLIWYWFEQHPAWSIQKSNWVISDSERTIGEFDLIALNHETGENWHIELACKFYLSTRKTRQWSDWKGTNVQDDLQHKMDKLKQQLNLSHHPASIEQLKANDIQIHRRAGWLKGWFFHHFRDISSPIQPRLAERHCNVGWWCTQSEWHAWMSQSSGEWLELSSLEWLQPVHAIEHAPQSAAHIAQRWMSTPLDKAQMLAQVIEIDQKRVEVSRGFVVQDDWPGLPHQQ